MQICHMVGRQKIICHVYLFVLFSDAVAGHDPLDSTTYYSYKPSAVQLDNNPCVRGLRVGIPKVCYLLQAGSYAMRFTL